MYSRSNNWRKKTGNYLKKWRLEHHPLQSPMNPPQFSHALKIGSHKNLEINFHESPNQSVQNEEEIKRNPLIGLESSYQSSIGSNWGSKWMKNLENWGWSNVGMGEMADQEKPCGFWIYNYPNSAIKSPIYLSNAIRSPNQNQTTTICIIILPLSSH